MTVLCVPVSYFVFCVSVSFSQHLSQSLSCLLSFSLNSSLSLLRFYPILTPHSPSSGSNSSLSFVRLVLSLTASNLVLAVVVLPGLVASVVMGPSEPPLLKVLPSPLAHSRNGTLSLTPSPSPAPSGLGLLGREGGGWDSDVVRSFGRSWEVKGGPARVSFGEVVEGGHEGGMRAEGEQAMEMEVRQVEEEASGKEGDGEGEEERETEINRKDTKTEQEGLVEGGNRDQVALTLGVNKMEASKQESEHVRKDSEQGRGITRLKASARIRGKPVNIKLSINYVGALERPSEDTPERQQMTQSDKREQKTGKEKTEEQKTEQKTGNEKKHTRDNLKMEENEMEIDIEQEAEDEENRRENVEEVESADKRRKMIQERLVEGEEKWEGAEVLCQSAAFLTNLVTAASALTVAVIALDR